MNPQQANPQQQQVSAAPQAQANAIASTSEATQAIANLAGLLDRLIDTVEAETAHMRAGRLREAMTIEETKAELARSYAVESARLKAAQRLVAGVPMDTLKDLRSRHERFQKLLQTNLTVLATAHAVSEGIIRGVSGELAKKRAPSTYGAHGRTNAPARSASQPLAVSKSL